MRRLSLIGGLRYCMSWTKLLLYLHENLKIFRLFIIYSNVYTDMLHKACAAEHSVRGGRRLKGDKMA